MNITRTRALLLGGVGVVALSAAGVMATSAAAPNRNCIAMLDQLRADPEAAKALQLLPQDFRFCRQGPDGRDLDWIGFVGGATRSPGDITGIPDPVVILPTGPVRVTTAPPATATEPPPVTATEAPPATASEPPPVTASEPPVTRSASDPATVTTAGTDLGITRQ